MAAALACWFERRAVATPALAQQVGLEISGLKVRPGWLAARHHSLFVARPVRYIVARRIRGYEND
jgi:hypothetical protein